MTLAKKLFILAILDTVLIGAVYCYFSVINEEYYFPGNYEIAVAWIAYTIIFCFFITILFIAHHVIRANKRRKE
jgi:hypothetical protein